MSLEEVRESQRRVRQIKVEDSVLDYLQDIVDATRQSPEIQTGVSTRGALSFYRACQALALIENRDYVTPDDVKRMAVPVIAHRIVPKV